MGRSISAVFSSIAAVFFGYAITALLIFGTDQIFATAIPGFKTMARLPNYYFMTSLVTDSLYSAAGGWTCAAIAKTRKQAHALALIILGEIVGLVSTRVLWATVPHYFSFALLILYPPAVWIGARLRQE